MGRWVSGEGRDGWKRGRNISTPCKRGVRNAMARRSGRLSRVSAGGGVLWGMVYSTEYFDDQVPIGRTDALWNQEA